MLDSLTWDLRYSLRILARSPSFTLFAVLTLAVGIGLNTVMFSLVDGVLLRPLPYDDPDRLVLLREVHPRVMGGFPAASYLNFLDWRELSRSFDQMAAFGMRDIGLRTGSEHRSVEWGVVSASFFSMLRVQPVLGRGFLVEEDRPGASRVVLLSHNLWRTRFGSDPNIYGRTFELEGVDFTVVGVLPSEFRFSLPWDPTGIDAWVLIGPTAAWSGRGHRELFVLGRLRSEVSVRRAQAEMDTIARGLEQRHPATNAGWRIELVPLLDLWVGRVRTAFLALLGAVGFVLLIASANLANLLLARAASRRREVALRAALGAGRGRLVAQLLTESLVLATLGGAAGLLLAAWGTRLVVALSPSDVPRLSEVGIDTRVLGFALLLSLLTGVVFGLAPALELSRADLGEALKSGVRKAGRRLRGIRGLLVVVEVALALVLLMGTALMIRSLSSLISVEPGFERRDVLTLHLSLPESKHRGKEVAFYREILARLESLPGARTAACVFPMPLGARLGVTFRITDSPSPGFAERHRANYLSVTPNYFRAMGIPLKEGRDFADSDAAGAPSAVIVNKTLADRFWPGKSPLGKRILMGGPTLVPTDEHGAETSCEIVGVAGNVRHLGLDKEPIAELYAPFLRSPWRGTDVVVQTSSAPEQLARKVETDLFAFDRDLRISQIKSMQQVVHESLEQRRFNLILLGVFAGLAIALATVGIYGVTTHLVSARTPEIAIRIALGAAPGTVRRLVVAQTMPSIVLGLAFGAAGGYLLLRLLSSLLFGESAADPFLLVGVVALGATVALAAAYVPARRATKIDPMSALRYE